jgi:hypothetical protein
MQQFTMSRSDLPLLDDDPNHTDKYSYSASQKPRNSIYPYMQGNNPTVLD